MKKILSFLIIAAMMIGMVLPVCAAEPSETQRNVIYEAYLQESWINYEQDTQDAIRQNPDYAESIEQSMLTWEEYCATFPSIDEFYAFDFYGTYDDVSFYRIATGIVPVWGYNQMGDYCVFIKSVGDAGFYVYANGKLLNLFEAYENGVVTDAQLDALNASHQADAVMWKFGDVNNDKKLDVADVLVIKDFILTDLDYKMRAYADFDRNESVDVGDIIALKDHIMTL